MNDSKIIEFQKLYLKHYGKKLSLAEAENHLNALVLLIETTSESKANRDKGYSVISSQK